MTSLHARVLKLVGFADIFPATNPEAADIVEYISERVDQLEDADLIRLMRVKQIDRHYPSTRFLMKEEIGLRVFERLTRAK